MKSHVLLEKAKRYNLNSEINEVSGYVFNENAGYWVNSSTNIPMMSGDNPQRLESKKCDVETGEDQKGE